MGSSMHPGPGSALRPGEELKAEDKEWIPVTKLGLLVKDMKIKSLKEICLFSLPIKNSEVTAAVALCWWPHASPRDPDIVSAPVPKTLLMTASIHNCYTSARGCTDTLGNFTKATFDAISKT
ncbi:40S ribosomal protein S2 [Myotis brandtii]|uniref:Small ribosomal subunit protein uS5 n=1 Tax=Myotis brandtii TaxID=109478 RepID=S7MRK0_MYOBR|nr:40S ribosomal protein S2 [Myotis brandtii]